jgi:hypothetical protein
MLIEGAQVGRVPDFPSTENIPPFQERWPWFGGDMQTLRNLVLGGGRLI